MDVVILFFFIVDLWEERFWPLKMYNCQKSDQESLDFMDDIIFIFYYCRSLRRAILTPRFVHDVECWPMWYSNQFLWQYLSFSSSYPCTFSGTGIFFQPFSISGRIPDIETIQPDNQQWYLWYYTTKKQTLILFSLKTVR